MVTLSSARGSTDESRSPSTVGEDLAPIDEIRAIRPGAGPIVFSRPLGLGGIAAMVSGAAASALGHDGIQILPAIPDRLAARLQDPLTIVRIQ